MEVILFFLYNFGNFSFQTKDELEFILCHIKSLNILDVLPNRFLGSLQSNALSKLLHSDVILTSSGNVNS